MPVPCLGQNFVLSVIGRNGLIFTISRVILAISESFLFEHTEWGSGSNTNEDVIFDKVLSLPKL
jgi:hypothetical protein